jgi:hypothetical protein
VPALPGKIEHTLASWNGTGASTVQAVAHGYESRSAHGGVGVRFASGVPPALRPFRGSSTDRPPRATTAQESVVLKVLGQRLPSGCSRSQSAGPQLQISRNNVNSLQFEVPPKDASGPICRHLQSDLHHLHEQIIHSAGACRHLLNNLRYPAGFSGK